MYSHAVRRDLHVRVLRQAEARAVGVACLRKLRLEVVGEPEVVVDVRLKRARRDVAIVGLTIGFDLVRRALHQVGRLPQILDGQIELANRDVAVPPMAVQAWLVGMHFDGARVDFNRLAKAREIRRTASQPDRRVDVLRVAIVRGARGGQIGFELASRVGRHRRRHEQLVEERQRLGLLLRHRRRRETNKQEDCRKPRPHDHRIPLE